MRKPTPAWHGLLFPSLFHPNSVVVDMLSLVYAGPFSFSSRILIFDRAATFFWGMRLWLFRVTISFGLSFFGIGVEGDSFLFAAGSARKPFL